MTALVLSGFGASRGIARGRARLIARSSWSVPQYEVLEDQLGRELERYRRAVLDARLELKDIAERLQAERGEVQELIDAHLLMLEDSMLAEAPLEYIRSRSCNAEWALKLVRDELVARFRAMEDEYFRARADDIDEVVGRIQRQLNQASGRGIAVERLDDVIVVADQLGPAELADLAERGAVGFVCESGGALGHAAIVARALGLPLLSGVRGATEMISERIELIVDTERHYVLIDPDEARLDRYAERIREQREGEARLLTLKDLPTQTRDGVAIRLHANAESLAELELARAYGAHAIGLYRSEFLFLKGGSVPDEEQQYEAYRQAVLTLTGLPLTIRTLDVGADKQLPLGQDPNEPNPALGLRGIRLSLKNPELFRGQLRAILRAAAHGPVRLLLPMLIATDEVRQVRALLGECVHELLGQGLPCALWLPIGGMIETPAAALSIHRLLPHLDFVSIGTNDLVQYTLAIDRQNDQVQAWYDPLHPAVLDLLERVISATTRQNKPVAVCGEMAADPRLARLLLALGLKEFSVSPRQLLAVKRAITAVELRPLLEQRDFLLNASAEALQRFLGTD